MNTTTLSDTERSVLQDLETFTLMQKAVGIIYSYGTTNPSTYGEARPWIVDARHTIANPFYGRVAAGLYLELKDSCPTRLRTPWGRWDFGYEAGGPWALVIPELLERFGAKEHRPINHAPGGDIGPVYALYRVEQELLPTPAEFVGNHRAHHGEVLGVWRSLLSAYERRAPR